jgi:uncharacterized lipoprotein NlpE involved in copper resistance
VTSQKSDEEIYVVACGLNEGQRQSTVKKENVKSEKRRKGLTNAAVWQLGEGTANNEELGEGERRKRRKRRRRA